MHGVENIFSEIDSPSAMFNSVNPVDRGTKRPITNIMLFGRHPANYFS